MTISPGGLAGPSTPDVIREILRVTLGHPGAGGALTPHELRSYLQPLVKRVVQTGCGPSGLARWVRRQRGPNLSATAPPALVAALAGRLAEALLPPADPLTGTVIDRL